MSAPRTAIGDLRKMVERLIDCAAEHGDVWETPGTPEAMLVEAAALMKGIADALERAKDRTGLELVLQERDDLRRPR